MVADLLVSGGQRLFDGGLRTCIGGFLLEIFHEQAVHAQRVLALIHPLDQPEFKQAEQGAFGLEERFIRSVGALKSGQEETMGNRFTRSKVGGPGQERKCLRIRCVRTIKVPVTHLKGPTDVLVMSGC